MSVREVDVLSYVFDRLNETGLRAQGWSFKFNTNKTNRGICKFGKHRIELSKHILSDSFEAIKNTVNHEIAHALVGHSHGHNHVWRAKALELGCDGERCGGAFTQVREKAKWVGICPNGHRMLRHRRTLSTRTSCATCSPVFNLAYLIRWERNRA